MVGSHGASRNAGVSVPLPSVVRKGPLPGSPDTRTEIKMVYDMQRWPLAIALTLSATMVCAQHEVGRQPPDMAAVFAGPAPVVTEIDGRLWGFGARYKVEFGVGDVTFTPALGSTVPRNVPIILSLQSIGRGAEQAPVSKGARSYAGTRITYQHAEVAERYDVLAEGIEQSFAIDRLPRGVGDLVIRVAVSTDFVIEPSGAGLRLTLPGLGHLRVGGVTAIDARGRRVAGTIAHVDGALHLTVPASFVDSAVLPLVIDPLIGANFSLSAGSASFVDTHPDVAFDAASGVYLVVFERVYSATDHDVHGQRVSENGSLVGSRILIQNASGNDSQQVRVANIATTGDFAVVWHDVNNNEIRARIVEAATGALNSANGELVVASGGSYLAPDVGGETSSEDDAIVVWTEVGATSRAVKAAQIQAGAENVIDTTTLYSSGTWLPQGPVISNGNGETGNHMVVYQVNGLIDGDVRGVVIDRNITILDSTVPAFTGPLSPLFDDQKQPSVDGDGKSWVVAWATAEPSNPSLYDVVCRSHVFDAGAGVVAAVSDIMPITVQASDDEFAPTVVWTGGQTLVAWSDVDGGVINTYMKSVDPFSCDACESGTQFALAVNTGNDFRFSGAGEASGGRNGGSGALLVWQNDDPAASGDADVYGRLWEGVDGDVQNIGGGCGEAAGQAYASCALNGNAGFSLRLSSNVPTTPAILVISRQLGDIPCGPCSLRPDPYAGWVSATTTDSNAMATFNAAIPAGPALTGIDFYAQWIVSEPLNPGCYLFGSDLTDAISIRIQ